MASIASFSFSPPATISRESLSDSNLPAKPRCFSCQLRSSPSSFSSIDSSSLSNSSLDFRLRRRRSGSEVACSTTPFMGRVGLQWRDGNMSLLSFRGGTESPEKSDSSQFLSALLPFVVALTAVAALSYPSTFTWVSKDLYAPALGGIMLSMPCLLLGQRVSNQGRSDSTNTSKQWPNR